MKIVFVTTQGLTGSTVIGRVLPLAEELAKKHEVYILVHQFSPPYKEEAPAYAGVGVKIRTTGRDPFERTPSGKQRQRGFALALTMLTNAVIAAVKLIFLKPDAIIIVKSLPENVLAARLAALLTRPRKIILDVDDFELTANVTTSWTDRAAIHWAERTGAKLAHHIVAATPFLSDHFEQLTQGKKSITMIPTGLTISERSRANSGDVARGAGILNVKSSQENRSQNSDRLEASNLIYAGSISLSSGHRIDLLPDILAEVRAEYSDIQLHIFGSGDDEKKLKVMFQEKHVDKAVTWHGRFDVKLLTNQIPPEAILLDPVDGSIINRAKSSFRVALAVALGVPVVTSNIGIRPYLIPDALHERCFAKPDDAKDYAGRISTFLKNWLTNTEQAQLSEHARRFTWQTLTSEYEKIIAAR